MTRFPFLCLIAAFFYAQEVYSLSIVFQITRQDMLVGKILPHRGYKSRRTIKHIKGILVKTSFYLTDSTIIKVTYIDSLGLFEVPIPNECKGSIRISFNTYYNGKSKGYLVKIDRRDGRCVRDETAHPMVLKDSLGYDVYVFDMQRESELCLLRGEKIGYLPKWLVKQSLIKEAYYKERRALAWSNYFFSIYKCPIFHLDVIDSWGGHRIVSYTYHLIGDNNFAAPTPIEYSEHLTSYQYAPGTIRRLGGEKILINNVSVLAVSMKPFDI